MKHGLQQDVYAAQQLHLVDKKSSFLFTLGLTLLLGLIAVSLMLGRYPIAPLDAVRMLFSQLIPIDKTWTDQAQTLFFQVRLPRILLSCLVGCGLATAGAAYQGAFQNPLVSSDVLGASQGAALGAAIALLLGASSFVVTLMAFAFSLCALTLVLLMSRKKRGDQVLTVILVGIMVSSLASAGVSFTKLVADPTNQLPSITYWLMGSLTSTTLRDFLFALPLVLSGLVVLFVLRWRINLLTLGDDEARAMGVDARRMRLCIMVFATLITAACVSVSGMIGWVGLIVPHFVRLLAVCNYKVLIPLSMVFGAIFLLLIDNLSRLIYTAEIPIGILTAFIGAPLFLYLILKRQEEA